MSQQDTTSRQNKHNIKAYDQICVRIRRNGADEISRESIKAAADAMELSLNTFILSAIKDKIASAQRSRTDTETGREGAAEEE